MQYCIWTQDEYAKTWTLQTAGDKAAVKRMLLEELKQGRQPILTVEVPFSLQLEVGDAAKELKKAERDPEPPPEEPKKEDPENEADQDPPEQDKDTGE